MISIKDNSLFHSKMIINGKWIDSDDGSIIEVNNPADQKIIGNVPSVSQNQIEFAIKSAQNAFFIWKNFTAKERSAILYKWYNLVLDNLEDLATILTTEQGKPLEEAKGEIKYSASFIQWYAEEAKRAYGDTIPAVASNQRVATFKEPIGVCATIAPWNFPAGAMLKKLPPALAAGCTIIVKPAIQTPFTGLAFVDLAHRAGIPPGVLNAVTGKSSMIGEILTNSPIVKKISFTGSTEIGKHIYKQSSRTIKKLSLELGGNAPFIVFEDADIDAAVDATILSKFRHTGQTCVCANRIFVHENIYNEYSNKLVEAVRKLKVGNGFDEGVTQGPLIDYNALEKVENHVNDAISKGGKILIGGQRHHLGGTFFQPTVIIESNSSMLCFSEETFGPVAPLFRFSSEEEVIKLANDTPFGLAAYLFSKNISRVFRVSNSLEYGMVGCNTGMISSEIVPFGGVKQSGFGKEGSCYGMDEYMILKYLCFGNI